MEVKLVKSDLAMNSEARASFDKIESIYHFDINLTRLNPSLELESIT